MTVKYPPKQQVNHRELLTQLIKDLDTKIRSNSRYQFDKLPKYCKPARAAVFPTSPAGAEVKILDSLGILIVRLYATYDYNTVEWYFSSDDPALKLMINAFDKAENDMGKLKRAFQSEYIKEII